MIEVHGLHKRFKGKIDLAQAMALNDIKQQLANLVYPSFVRETPGEWLKEIPRYLKAIEQRFAAIEVPVQVDLAEQQRQVLEVLHLQFVTFALVALGGDALPVRDDVQVVAAQLRLADALRFEEVAGELVEEQRLAVVVDAFVAVVAQAQLQRPQAAALEEAQHPAVEHQLLVEAALAGRAPWCSRHQSASTANMRSRNSGSIWRSLSSRVAPPCAAVWVSTEGMLWSPLR